MNFGENCVLQQSQGLFQGSVIATLQQENRPLDLGAHCGKCSTPMVPPHSFRTNPI
jgi:hypothetical protein